MALELKSEVSRDQRDSSCFAWTIQSLVGAFLCLLENLCTRRTRPAGPQVVDSDREPPLTDCEKDPQRHRDVYQTHAHLLATLKRRDAADAAFEARALALLAPVKGRLGDMTRDSEGMHDTVSVPHCPDLPPAPQIFYGRDRELSALVGMFSQPRQAHAALLGEAGAGKSALALALLHHAQIRRKFGPRRFLVPCDTPEGVVGVYRHLASALGRLRASPETDRAFVLSALASSHSDSLVVLDDLDTIWVPPRVLEGILSELAAIPGVSLLLTLRGTQRPAGPVYMTPCPAPLGPLPLPAARALFLAISDFPVDDAPPTYADTSLLVDVASEHTPGAQHNDTDVDAALLDALLQRVGCLPRGVVLLAQRAQYEPLAFLLESCADGDVL
ncbi:hypothetical protein C8R44DRAFT_767983 [Mycena epipterygia]|nr:hypothetical protein C8R44DRAFT_767983 [Mycena epipterygia]